VQRKQRSFEHEHCIPTAEPAATANLRPNLFLPPMKVLVNCPLPFALAHGGQQIQIERTLAALRDIGIEIDLARWWDDTQTADLIHYFGRMPAGHIKLAHQKKFPVVIGELLTGAGSRSRSQLRVQKMISCTVERFAPRNFSAAFNWESYRLADAVIANTSWEAHLMTYLFAAPPTRIHIVPNGVEDVFLNSSVAERGKWLVCTATITERKRILELAQAAISAQTPLWIIGKAYADTDPYALQFFALTRQHSQFIRYEGAISDRAQLAKIYRAARGFVLLSTMETRSLSAEEAAACACPLLLGDLPWAHATFGEHATYCPISSPERTAGYLKQFYQQAPVLPSPIKPLAWIEVARQLKTIYEGVLSAPK
jgi:glycosyltransferase involved in cell wall biosynthesis